MSALTHGAAALAALCLTACANIPALQPVAPPPAPVIAGGDRDAHGCIGSAGYQWCGYTQQCERSWEMKHLFSPKAPNFEAYCAQQPAQPQAKP